MLTFFLPLLTVYVLPSSRVRKRGAVQDSRVSRSMASHKTSVHAGSAHHHACADRGHFLDVAHHRKFIS